MTRYVMDQWSSTLDYPTLGFTADPNDILIATAAPDGRWSVNGNQSAAETVTRYVIGVDPSYVEPTDGHVLTWSDAGNAYVPTAPVNLLDDATLAADLSATYARLTSIDVRSYGTFTEASSYTVNTTTLQAANDACTALGIGRIVIPPGTYDIAGYIQDSRVEIYGPGATLRHPGKATTTLDMIESRLRATTGTVAADSTSLVVADATGFERGAIVMIRAAGGILDTQYTTLVAGIDSSQTTGITLTSSLRFPTTGWMMVGTEIIGYTGITADELTGVTRGAFGSTAAAHSLGDIIGLSRVHYAEIEAVSGTTITLNDGPPVGVTSATVTVGIIAPKITSLRIDGNRTQSDSLSPMPIDWRTVRAGRVFDVEVTRGQSAVFLNRGARDCVLDRVVARDCGTPESSLGASFWMFQACCRNRLINFDIVEDGYIGVAIDDRTTTATEWDGPCDDNIVALFEISVKSHGFAPGVDITASNRNRVLSGAIKGANRGVVISNGAGQYNVSDAYIPPAAGNELGGLHLDVTTTWTLDASGNFVHDCTFASGIGSVGSNTGLNMIYACSKSAGGAPKFGTPFEDGSSAAPGIAFASDTNTGFYSIAADQWQWVAGGAAVARLRSDGILMSDGKNIEMGTSTGTKFGSAATVKMGFYGATPVVRPAAYTQTYATATRTHAAPTAAAVATTAATLAAYGFTQAQADALPVAINALVTDLANTKQVLNQLLDDLQTLGLLA